MYFVYGCPKVLCLRPEPEPGEEVLAVAFNPSGSLAAVVSSFRVSVWSGGKDHVPLGVLALQLRGLLGTSLLWRPDSGVLAVVSTTGNLSFVSVRRKASARPVSERLAVPDWFEPQDPHVSRLPSEDDGIGGIGEAGSWKDMWADPAEADLSLTAVVDKIPSKVSAICLGRFGQHVLVGTTDGELYGVSWEGQILCRYAIVALTTASARDGNEERGCPRTALDDTRLLDACATSMAFNDTLQLLALTTDDGNFFLGALSKVSCHLRRIDITEQARASRPAIASCASAFVTRVSSPSGAAAATATGLVGGHGARPLQSQTRGSVHAGVDPREPTSSDTRGGHGSWSGWSLWAKGRGAVAAAAAAAVDVISAATGPSLNSDTNGVAADNISSRRPVKSEAAAAGDHGTEGKGEDGMGESQAASGESGYYAEKSVDDSFHATGAVAVEFSAKGCLMAVALVDGTVLLTRVERYTSGVRARHKLQISNTMLQKTDSYTLQVASDEVAENTGEEVEDAASRASVACLSRETSEADAQALEGRPRSAVFNLKRSNSISPLWGVEVHQLHCLSLQPWLGSGEGGGSSAMGSHDGEIGPAGRVLSMCFSFDGWALAVGHEGALTIWSTEDGSRLVSTVSHTYQVGSRSSRSLAHLGAVSETPSQNEGEAEIAHGVDNGLVHGNGGKAGSHDDNVAMSLPAWSTLDLVAGGARSLTWGCEGYRLLSVGGEGGMSGTHVGIREGVTKEEAEVTARRARHRRAQSIVAFDFLRRARSNLSSALLSMQGPDRIALVDSQPWSAQVLLWRVLPVHPGYLASNAPLRHVSTSRAGTYVAVAGSRGLAVYSRPMNRWRLFGNIEQEREVQVAGMCWWGDSALVVASRLKHGFILLMYSRKHLDSQSLLLPPIKLPVGMRPLFMQGVQEGRSRPGSDVLLLLVAGSTSYLVYRFSCEKDLGEGGSSVSYTILHEGTLPHVLENMDMRALDQRLTVEPRPERPQANAMNEQEQQPSREEAEIAEAKFSATPNGVNHSEGTGNREGRRERPNGIATQGDKREDFSVQVPPGNNGSQPQLVAQLGNERQENGVAMAEKGAEGASADHTGPETPVPALTLPEIGPPKRVMLLPEVHPRSIALLDYDGNLVMMQLGNGEIKAVAEGVESIVDLTGVSEVWEAWETPLLIHPCYLLRRKARVSSDSDDGPGFSPGGNVSEEYSVWCPAMRLDPMSNSIRRLLSPRDAEPLSPVLSLDPGASCDPERVDLGLQPLLGTMVHVSQVVCRPRVSNTPPLPPCYELRTHLRPILHMVLRHLLIVSELQLLNSPLPHLAGSEPATEPMAERVSEILSTSSEQCVLQQPQQRQQGEITTQTSNDPGVDNGGGDAVGFDGEDEAAQRSSVQAEQGEQPRRLDWLGTSRDAFEIAVSVLKRCREDAVLVEALPDTLELLVRACMEALRLAGDRARNHTLRNRTGRRSIGRNVDFPLPRTSTTSAGSTPPSAISELELARAVMTDCVYIAQLAPECFHEVIARVARKAEPESYGLLFPLHLISRGGGGGGAFARCESNGGSSSPKRWAHPTHLFDHCVSKGKLTTAAWYLPLVRDDVAYEAGQRHVGLGGPLSDVERENIMPLDMWGLTGPEWPFGLSHALACVLLAESLVSKQYAFLPEVWLFARKREQSTPHHRHPQDQENHGNSAQAGVPTGTVKTTWRQQPQQGKLRKIPSQLDRATPTRQAQRGREVFSEERRSGGSMFYHTPWWARGEGAVIEARIFEATASDRRPKVEAPAPRRRRSLSLGGSGADTSLLLRSKQVSVPGSDDMPSSIEEGIASKTLFGQRTALRLHALDMSGRARSAVLSRRIGGENSKPCSLEAASRNEPGASGLERGDVVPASQLAESERGRLYHLPFSRDAASVVSRFLWKQLNELRVKAVIKSFEALASSPTAREAGLDSEMVLGALSPARRSMVGSQRRSSEETMAGLTVSLAEMFKVSVENLSLLAMPLEAQDHPPADGDSNTPVEILEADTAAQQEGPGSGALTENGTASGDRDGGSPRSLPASDSATGAATNANKAGRARQADHEQYNTSSISVRWQLELLGKLCRSIGHGEGALVCATLLRDEVQVMVTLSNASQTLRVGYGKFVSDLEKQLIKARELATTAIATSAFEETLGDIKATVRLPGLAPARVATGASSYSHPEVSKERDAVDKGLRLGSWVGDDVHDGAAALLGLQRFGGQCVRNLAEGAASA